MFNLEISVETRLFFALLLILGLSSCDSHPTPKSNYSDKIYDGFTIVEVEWDGIPLKEVIQKHYELAKTKHQKVFIQITAEWCSPCKRLREKTNDPLMQKAYQGAYIIRLDRDEWEQDFPELGIKKTPIPIFWELKDQQSGLQVDLKVTDYSLDGNYWKEITAKRLSPILSAYFSGKARIYITSQKTKTNDL